MTTVQGFCPSYAVGCSNRKGTFEGTQKSQQHRGKAGFPAPVWAMQDVTAHQPNEYCVICTLLNESKVTCRWPYRTKENSDPSDHFWKGLGRALIENADPREFTASAAGIKGGRVVILHHLNRFAIDIMLGMSVRVIIAQVLLSTYSLSALATQL